MKRWEGRVALVTGASAGIGAAIVTELVQNGVVVVGLARRVDRVEALKKQLEKAPGKLHALAGDVGKEADIVAAFGWVKKNLGGVDILVNNAGVLEEVTFQDGNTEKLRHILDVNVMAPCICIREALRSLKERGVTDGHIVNINSIAGHSVPSIAGYGMYTASKHAITSLTESLRKELCEAGSDIKVTSVSPGLVQTEIFSAAAGDASTPHGVYNRCPSLRPKDIADGVIYALGTPPHVQVHELMIKPVQEKNL